MDKEAQENLIELRDALDFHTNEWWGGLRQEPYASNYRQSLMSLLKNLGYCKLLDKPPPLVKSPYNPDDEKDEIYCDIGEMRKYLFLQGAQAQREADIKHYEEVKDGLET